MIAVPLVQDQEKGDHAKAIKSLEKLAKNGFRCDAFEEAQEMYLEYMEEGDEEVSEAVAEEDVDALKALGKKLGKSFKDRIKRERAELKKALS